MSSYHSGYGENTQRLFDNQFNTFIHTADDKSDPGIVTLNLARPIFVDSVILVNRDSQKGRIRNAAIELVDSKGGTTVCGHVEFKTSNAVEVVHVKCENSHIKSKQVLVTKDPIQSSITIAELRICSSNKPSKL